VIVITAKRQKKRRTTRMNSVALIGRLTKDPEQRYTPNGMSVTRFTIAVDGTKEHTDFIRVTTFGKTADNVGRYLAKGRQVAVLGHIQTGSFKGKDGETVYATDVIGDRVEFLGKVEQKAEPKQEQYRVNEDLPEWGAYGGSEEC
jgi:single-strand DNA-binding protein